MQITNLQRIAIDLEVIDFAATAGIGIVQVQVAITEGQEGNVFLNLYHAPADAPEKYSMLATQLRPDGSEPWTEVEGPSERDRLRAISDFEVGQFFAERFPAIEGEDLPF